MLNTASFAGQISTPELVERLSSSLSARSLLENIVTIQGVRFSSLILSEQRIKFLPVDC